MTGKYRGCNIEVERDSSEFLTFAIFDDGYEVTSGFSKAMILLEIISNI